VGDDGLLDHGLERQVGGASVACHGTEIACRAGLLRPLPRRSDGDDEQSARPVQCSAATGACIRPDSLQGIARMCPAGPTLALRGIFLRPVNSTPRPDLDDDDENGERAPATAVAGTQIPQKVSGPLTGSAGPPAPLPRADARRHVTSRQQRPDAPCSATMTAASCESALSPGGNHAPQNTIPHGPKALPWARATPHVLVPGALSDARSRSSSAPRRRRREKWCGDDDCEWHGRVAEDRMRATVPCTRCHEACSACPRRRRAIPSTGPGRVARCSVCCAALAATHLVRRAGGDGLLGGGLLGCCGRHGCC
jgi:hypothetical protein